MFWLAAAAVFTATASAVTLSQLGGKTNRPTSPVRSSGLAATTGLTLTPTKVFAHGGQRDRQRGSAAHPARQVAGQAPAFGSRSVRKRSTRHHSVTHATVAPKQLDVAREFHARRTALELDGCVKLSARDAARRLRRQAAVRRTKASLHSARTAASAQAEALLGPNKETYVQWSRP